MNEMFQILIADSKQRLLGSIKESLENNGYKVSTALDGKATIKSVKQNRFDVIILSAQLSDMKGIDVLKEINNISPGSEIVIATRHPSARFLNEGAFTCIPRPLDSEMVDAVIRKVMEASRAIREKDLLIEDLRRTNQELEQKRDELIQSEKLSFAGRMAASVAHEIRNPLNIIGMSIEQLHSELKKKDPRREYTKVIIENIERVDRLIGEFTNIAKPPRLKLRWGNVNDTINEVIRLTEPKLKERKAHVINDLDKDIPRIKIDKENMIKAFSNMLLNACDALPKNGGKIWITSRRDNNYIIIKFRNKGKPIPREDLIRIFDPFFSTKRGGTGLGLSIVYTIIGSHGGNIDVESNRRKGTVFTVRFPL